jgi:hypothetical protein
MISKIVKTLRAHGFLDIEICEDEPEYIDFCDHYTGELLASYNFEYDHISWFIPC